MKLKKIIAAVGTVAMLGNMITASAADVTADMHDVASNIYLNGVFSAEEYTAGDKVTVIVKNADASDIVYANQTTVSDDGTYSVKFRADKIADPDDYTVSVRVGNTLVNTAITVKTESFFEADVELKDSLGGPLNLLSDTDAIAEISMQNYFDDEITMKAIISFYDSENKLLSASVQDVDFGYEDTVTATTAVTVPENTDYAKALLWKSETSMIPVTAPVTNDTEDYNEDVYLFMFGDSLGHVNDIPSADGKSVMWHGVDAVRAAVQSNPDVVQQGWSCYIDDYLDINVDNLYYNCYSGWTMRDSLAGTWTWSYRNYSEKIEEVRNANPDAKIYAMINMGTNDYKWVDGVQYPFTLPDEYSEYLKMMYEGYGLVTDESYSYRHSGNAPAGVKPVTMADYEASSAQIESIKGLKELGAELILITPAANVKTVAENYHINNVGTAMKNIANADLTDGIHVLDIYSPSYKLFYNELGMDAARAEYTKSVEWYAEFYDNAGEVVDGKYVVTVDGAEKTLSADWLHYNPKGAAYVGKLICEALAESDCSLKYHISDSLYN